MPLHVDLTINGADEDELKKGSGIIACKVNPGWKEENLQYQVYTSGNTNHLIGVWQDDSNKQVLVRVYGQGTDLFIDREAEKKNIEVLNKVGCAPALLAVLNNGICYAYTIGIPTTCSSIFEEPIWRAVTHEMARFHKTPGGDEMKPILFPKIRQLLSLVPDQFEEAKQKRLDDHKYTKTLLGEEISHLEKCLSTLGCPVVLSHNDILLGNVIWNESERTASFIDFEYGGANYQAYDIANHFNEFAGFDEVDYSLYPNVEFQYKWIRSYLAHYYEKNEAEVEEKEVEKWYIWANKFALMSHLFWGIWSLIQAYHSKIDFDFIQYGIIRFDEYFNKKEEFLSLTPKK